MSEILSVDICVIGAGSGGLTVAAGASQLGASTVLIERAEMGGDCLNFGCVPSKALLAAAHAADTARNARRFGVVTSAPETDFAAVHRHVHGVIDAIAPNDSEERFTGLGVNVIRASARFTGPDMVEAGGQRIRARRFVIATGSSPFVPPIPGLDQVPYLTNETVFDLTERPAHLVVIGGGPIGCELAQAHRRLGSAVTILEAASILPKDDPELVDILRMRLKADGIDLREGAKVTRVERRGPGVAVTVERDGAQETVEGSHLLVAVGRRANLRDLNLEAAGIAHTPQGVVVDAGLRTANRRVYAIGDAAAGGYQFTHNAGYQAGIVIRNALFRLPAKVDTRAMPWVTYTALELAHVGLSEKDAKEKHGAIRILRWSFAENDRAQAERATEGFVKAIVTKRGHILGATIVGARAGEMIQLWTLAIGQKLKIGAIANMIAPYPTFGEASKRAAGSFYTAALFSERTKRIVRFLACLG
ncbi:MAG: FAD-dependent oxidoreductase [Alphaproteobacteria bacterium]|nr:FAD-dependent oxidoreductase [Alphaproteobacteria bacterium]